MIIRLPSFKTVNAFVVGDLMLDCYWSGSTHRISPEAPVPIVKMNSTTQCPGGAGNVAMNLASLGVNVHVSGLLGCDDAAQQFVNIMQATNINTSAVQRNADVSTIVKTRVFSGRQQLIRLDSENEFHFSNSAISNAIDDALKQYIDCNVIIISDYGKGSIQNPQALIRSAMQRQIPVFVDPKGSDYQKYQHAYCLTPNQHEFEQVFGVCRSNAELEQKGLKALHQLNLKAILITRGANGMSLIRENVPSLHLPATSNEAIDVTGAGDTVISVLAASVAAGESLETGMCLANIAAGITVGQLGTTTITIPALQQAIPKPSMTLGVLSEEDALIEINKARQRQEKIVMTNGCFDLLHSGHIGYLEDARALGDRLVVAVNEDESIRQLKGPGRPVQTVTERMIILAGLRAVDWVVPFSAETPLELIQKISPDVLVKGVDYEGLSVVGSDHVLASGGAVKYVGPPKYNSSSELISKIRTCIEGADQ